MKILIILDRNEIRITLEQQNAKKERQLENMRQIIGRLSRGSVQSDNFVQYFVFCDILDCFQTKMLKCVFFNDAHI